MSDTLSSLIFSSSSRIEGGGEWPSLRSLWSPVLPWWSWQPDFDRFSTGLWPFGEPDNDKTGWYKRYNFNSRVQNLPLWELKSRGFGSTLCPRSSTRSSLNLQNHNIYQSEKHFYCTNYEEIIKLFNADLVARDSSQKLISWSNECKSNWATPPVLSKIRHTPPQIMWNALFNTIWP